MQTKTRSTLLALCTCVLTSAGCTDDTSGEGETDGTSSATTDMGDTDDPTDTSGDTNPDPLLIVDLLDPEVLLDAAVVDCTLTNGSQTQCHQLSFSGAIPFDDGPYCPETIDDVGGLGVYDGDTNPGFQVMKQSLWDAMEADGYDIVDDQGNVRIIDDLMGQMPGENGWSFCLALPLDPTLTLTYLIPVVPEDAEVNTIDIVEKLGMSLAGVPLTGHPPSATEGPPGPMGGFDGFAAIPSLDPCGGHPDPMGYFHAHFIPESISGVLDAFGIDEVSCTATEQDVTALSGYAFDGYPVYAAEDPSGPPADLDACNGHFGVTAHYPEGVYHYHASATDAPNMPACLNGASATNSVTIQ